MSGSSDFSEFNKLPQIIIAGIVGLMFVTIIALIGLQLVGGVTDSVDGDAINRTASPDPIVGEYVGFESEVNTVGGEILQIYTVNDSTGYGIQLDGSDDSYVQSREDIQISDTENFTISTWARVREGAGSQNMTVLDAGGRAIIQYNGSDGNWSGWYYDDGSANSWRVNVSAPNQPGNLTNIMLRKNSTHLNIYRNNTLGESVNVSDGNNSINVQTSNGNFNGTIDETRTFSNSLNDSQRASLVNDPIHPLPNATRTARIMYDENSGTETEIYFTSTVADISNGVWVLALNGNELVEGTDYELRERTAGIRALSGGKIDGAPVVWIDYEFQDSDVSELVPGIKGGFGLLADSVIVIPAVAIISVLLFGLLFVFMIQGTDIGFGENRGNR